jgi:pterin-4a-carbinolamine dehydratase
VRYSNITLSLVTHDEGGITPRDVALARQVEAIRRKAGVPA